MKNDRCQISHLEMASSFVEMLLCMDTLTWYVYNKTILSYQTVL